MVLHFLFAEGDHMKFQDNDSFIEVVSTHIMGYWHNWQSDTTWQYDRFRRDGCLYVFSSRKVNVWSCVKMIWLYTTCPPAKTPRRYRITCRRLVSLDFVWCPPIYVVHYVILTLMMVFGITGSRHAGLMYEDLKRRYCVCILSVWFYYSGYSRVEFPVTAHVHWVSNKRHIIPKKTNNMLIWWIWCSHSFSMCRFGAKHSRRVKHR